MGDKTVPTSPIATRPDYADRLINAVVIIVVIIVAAVVFSNLTSIDGLKNDLLKQLAGTDKNSVAAAREQLQLVLTQSTSMWGNFTTFLGTAIGAFFGISVSASAARAAGNAASSLAQQNATTQAQNTTLQQQVTTKDQTLGQLKSMIQDLPSSDDPTHNSAVVSLQQATRHLV